MKKTLSHQVDIQIDDDDLEKEISENIYNWVVNILDLIFDKNICLSVNVTSSKHVQLLNAQYRKKNQPTNVLSFPDVWPKELEKKSNTYFIGDLVLCPEIIKKEAIEQKKILKHHWCHLLVHGILHLIGFDHINNTDAEQMELKEIAILKKMQIANPYLESFKNAYS